MKKKIIKEKEWNLLTNSKHSKVTIMKRQTCIVNNGVKAR